MALLFQIIQILLLLILLIFNICVQCLRDNIHEVLMPVAKSALFFLQC